MTATCAAARAACWLCLAAWLAGCASVETPPPAVRSDKPPIQQFSLSARLSIRIEDRLDVVRMRWTRDGGEERIAFFSPFGSQIAELTQPAAGPATLRRGKELETAASINAFTGRLLGVDLDIAQVALWIQAAGLAVGETRTVPSADGTVWHVTLDGIAQVEGYDHATRLTAAREGISVKMVIEEWQPR